MPTDEDAAFRRAWNGRAAASEAVGCRLAARLHLLHLLKLWFARRLPVPLALAGLPHSLIGEGLALLAERRRALYVEYREVLITATLMQMAWTVVKLATDGAMDAAYVGHRGSAAGVLGLIILTNFCPALLIVNLYLRLLLPWSAAGLLLQSLLPLWASRGICERVLLAPGVLEPLARLHRVLDYSHMHGSALALLLAGSPPIADRSDQQAAEGMHQCVAINAWTVLLLGLALPLLAIQRLECRARREYKERLAAAQNQPPQPMEAQEADQPPMLPITGAWVGDVFLLSCCAWQAATLLSDFLAPR